MSQKPTLVLEDSLAEQSPKSSLITNIPLRIFAICLTSALVAVHYTNYGPLIPTLIQDLHISNGQAGLLSTFLFLGLAVMYIPAGILIDRFGQRRILLGASLLLVIGAVLLPLAPNLAVVLLCRFLVGLGSGAAFVAGAGIAASLGKHSALGQGLYGGSVQVGAALGLLLTPQLLTTVGWRGSFLIWGLLGILSIIAWLFISDGYQQHTRQKMSVGTALRSRAVWTLGLSHMGTFGLGNAIAAWIAIYLAFNYGLPLALAATLGSLALLVGMFCRPLGGILIGRKIIGAIPLLRIGTILGCLGVAFLAIPLHFPPLAFLGMLSIAIGSTIPYTSVFNEAANLRDVGKGVAQGFVSVISTPTVILGPPLIGFLFQSTHSFTLAFGAIALFDCIAVTASFLAGPAVKREKI